MLMWIDTRNASEFIIMIKYHRWIIIGDAVY